LRDKSERLKAMVGEFTGQPKKEKTDKVVHYKDYKPSGITPAEFLKMPPKKFHADLCDDEGTWKITYTLHRNTDNCLTYIAEIRDYKESYFVPVYIFKRECGFQKRMMKRAYYREAPPAWQVISADVNGEPHLARQLLRKAYEKNLSPSPQKYADHIHLEKELDTFVIPLCKYFGFGYHQPIP